MCRFFFSTNLLRLKADPLGFVRAFEAVQGSRKTLRNAIKKDKNNKDSIRQQLHKAEVNLAWCQYYPLQYKWHPFPSPKKSKNKKESNELQRVRKRFWNLVERSMSEGTLLDLRVGKFGGVDDCQEVEFEAQHKGELIQVMSLSRR